MEFLCLTGVVDAASGAKKAQDYVGRVGGVEARADTFVGHARNQKSVAHLIRAIRTDAPELSVLYTNRTLAERGPDTVDQKLSGTEEDARLQSYYQVLTLPPEVAPTHFDIELATKGSSIEGLVKTARGTNPHVQVIGSYHDFTGFDMAKAREALIRAKDLPVDIAKLAVLLETEDDCTRLIDFCNRELAVFGKPHIIIGMGNNKWARHTRFCYEQVPWRSVATYLAPDDQPGNVLGQPTVAEFLRYKSHELARTESERTGSS